MRSRIICYLAAALSPFGCAASRQEHLASVAKDWAMTIRASQVIPVYPIIEDLQPGDVFLVRTPIARQAEEWEARGFLALDQHIARLDGVGYQSFYDGSFGVHSDMSVPEGWRQPRGATREGGDSWASAPRAYFPNYTFKVERTRGINLAIPIRSVPLGMNLMGTESATGSVAITGVYTYGVSLEEIRSLVESWSARPDTQVLLERMTERAGRELYLRVVHRVYLAGRLVVALTNDQKGDGGLRAFPAPGRDGGASSVASGAGSAEALSGVDGSVTIAFSSTRAVTAVEEFPRPLVIGYLAFDFPVLEDGRLGPPLSTVDLLRSRRNPDRIVGEPTDAQFQTSLLLHAIRGLSVDDAEGARRALDRAAALLGGDFARDFTAGRDSGDAVDAFERALSRYEIQRNDPETVQREAARSLEAAWKELRHGSGPKSRPRD